MNAKRLEQLLTVAALVAIAAGCIYVLLPFLSAILWAMILCFASWPLYGWLHRLLRERRTVAALLTTLVVATLFLAPFAIVGPRLADEIRTVTVAIGGMLEEGPPGPPAWIADVPWIGPDLAAYWADLASDSVHFSAALQPYLGKGQAMLLELVAYLGLGVLQLSLSLFIAFFLYRDGKTLAARLTTVAHRFAGARAQALLEVAGNTTRGVVYGVLGTALAQGLVAAVGFKIVGLSAYIFLGLLTFFLSLIPMGPPFVWLPVGLWLLNGGHTVAGFFILGYGLLVISTVDNFIKPYFISREGRLPFVLVFLGVLGGVLAFGFIGVFLGPVLLAIGYSLAKEWSATELVPPATPDKPG